MNSLTIEDHRPTDSLCDEWQSLWHRDPLATPFQSPAWLMPWIHHFSGGDARILAVRNDGRLVALLPLFRLRDRGAERLLICGAGNSDYLDGVFDAAEGGAAATVLLRYLQQSREGIRVDLFALRPNSRLLQAAVSRRDGSRAQGACAVLPLSRHTELARIVPKRMLDNLRYGLRRAGKNGGVHFETVDTAGLECMIERLVDLHGARWSARGLPGVLAGATVRAFHRDAAPGLLQAGLLRLLALRIDERVVAILYGFAAKGRFYYYLSGFDPDYAAVGPGNLIVGHAIECAIDERLHEFDFLAGREAYKYRWGAVNRPLFARTLNCGREARAS